MPREITTHKIDGLPEPLRILVADEPGQGYACHEYRISWGNSAQDLGADNPMIIKFQNGPISESGVNGLSNESLLAIVLDRLEGFQSGPFACKENQHALEAVREAMAALHFRTAERLLRRVEGKNEV